MSFGSVILKSGKADFVKRMLPSGKIQEVCLCKYNADFSPACIGQVHGSKLEEVIENNGKYTKENLSKYRKQGIIDQRCIYCYAKGTGSGNWGKVTPAKITERTRKDFEEFHPKIIRIGKNTECGHFFYEPQLVDFLKLCEEYQTRTILINKMLKFKKNIAQLLKDTDSVVQYSIGFDKFEPGAISQGFKNSWRIKQAEKYHKFRVNTTLTVVCDVTQSIEENIKKGSSLDLALKSSEKTGTTLRIIPLRLNSNYLCNQLTGKTYAYVTHKPKNPNQPELIQTKKVQMPYLKRANNERIPAFFHKDFKELIKQGIGICGQVGGYEYCDKCNLFGDKKVKFPVSQLKKIKYTIRDKKRRGNRRPRKNKRQLEFKFN